MSTFSVVFEVNGERGEVEVRAMNAGAAKRSVLAMYNGNVTIFAVNLV